MTADDETQTQSRSPRSPSVSLEKALERARELLKEHDRHWVRPQSAGAAWGYSEKSSGWRTTLASLLMYGILQDTGSGNDRKVKLTEDAWRYLVDERPEQRASIVKKLALSPKLMREIWGHWGSKPPGDAECRSQLRIERNFTDDGAQEFLGIYKANIAFAKLANSDIPPAELKAEEVDDVQENPSLSPRQEAKLMPTERIVFTEESQPNQYLKLIASGDVDDSMLEALQDFVKRQRKRLGRISPPEGEG